ncbi:MAG: hypothetical protein QME77_09640 [bacterium]|nr:hypothetical protein [bacterium]
MRRSLIALAVVAVLVMAASVPASAQTWIQLRYWSTNNSVYENGSTWSSPLLGFSLRRDVMQGAWALSFNFDSGSVNWTGGYSAPGSFNRFWNLNVHRNFPLANGRTSFYAGYGGGAFEEPTWPWYVRLNGFRFGVEGKLNFRENWYLTGDLGYTPRQTGSQLNFAFGGFANMPASLLDYKVALGYAYSPTWGVEVGYRGVDLRYDPTIMCGGSTSCGLRWGGWYVGLNFTMP